VTAFGPGHWLMFVAMYGCLLVMVFYAGINGPAD
jgi:hypothetical protein